MKIQNPNIAQEIDAEVAKLLSSGINIPPQPQIVLDVARLLESKHCDIREMAAVIGHDVGLTAMLYKITRSTAYSRPRPPESVEQILTLIGVHQTALLVQSYGLSTAFQAKNKAFEEFWQRSTEIAQICSLICEERTSSRMIAKLAPEQAYMVGIFHDCGVPILMQRFPDYCKAIGTAVGYVDVGEEDRIFQVDHCSIGYLLARHWRLPDFIADAIQFHHDIGRIRTSKSRLLVVILQMALFLYAQERGVSCPEWEKVSGVVLDELGLQLDELPEFCEQIAEMFCTVKLA